MGQTHTTEQRDGNRVFSDQLRQQRCIEIEQWSSILPLLIPLSNSILHKLLAIGIQIEIIVIHNLVKLDGIGHNLQVTQPENPTIFEREHSIFIDKVRLDEF